jgi:hypothetical protein
VPVANRWVSNSDLTASADLARPTLCCLCFRCLVVSHAPDTALWLCRFGDGALFMVVCTVLRPAGVGPEESIDAWNAWAVADIPVAAGGWSAGTT